MRQNPFQHLIGKRVMVVGQTAYKGYHGVIKDVSLAGVASVFFSVHMTMTAHNFKISNLCLL